MADATQTVVDDKTKAQPEAAAAGTDAPKADDLDSLLAEFAAQTKPAATATKPETTTETTSAPAASTDKRIEAIERRYAEEAVARDLRPVIEKIKGKVPEGFFEDTEIEDWVAARAQRDPRLANAWMNRHQNPTAWGKVVDAIGEQMAAKFKKLPDRGATEDRAAVTAAVRGASKQAPEGKAPDYSRKSDAEFAKDVEEKYGFRPL